MSIEIFFDEKEQKIRLVLTSDSHLTRTKLIENLKAKGVFFEGDDRDFFIPATQFHSVEEFENTISEVHSVLDDELSLIYCPVITHDDKIETAKELLSKFYLNLKAPIKADAAAMPEISIPNEYLCPLTLELMRDPVFDSKGYTYERQAIENWFKTSNICPKTLEPLSSKLLIPNHSLRALIHDFVQTNPPLSSAVVNAAPASLSAAASSPVIADSIQFQTRIADEMQAHLSQKNWKVPLGECSSRDREAILQELRQNGFEANIDGYRERGLYISWYMKPNTERQASAPYLVEILNLRQAVLLSEHEQFLKLAVARMSENLLQNTWQISLDSCSDITRTALIKQLRHDGFEVGIDVYQNRGFSIRWTLKDGKEEQVVNPMLKDLLQQRKTLLGSELALFNEQLVAKMKVDLSQDSWQLSLDGCSEINKNILIDQLRRDKFAVNLDRTVEGSLILAWKLTPQIDVTLLTPVLKETLLTRARVIEDTLFSNLVAKYIAKDFNTNVWQLDLWCWPQTCHDIAHRLIINGINAQILSSSNEKSTLRFSLTAQANHVLKDPLLKEAFETRQRAMTAAATQSASASLAPQGGVEEIPSAATLPSSDLGFFSAAKSVAASPSIILPLTLRDSDSSRILKEIVSSADDYEDSSQKINAIKGLLFRHYWQELIVSKFPYLPVRPNCFISYEQYHASSCSPKTPSEALVRKLIDDLRRCPLLSVMNENTWISSYSRAVDQAMEKIRTADQVICVLAEKEAMAQYFQTEFYHLSAAATSKPVIPVAVNGDIEHCFPPSLQHLSGLIYRSEMDDYQYSQLVAEVFARLGALNESLKASFNQAGIALHAQVEREFPEPELLSAIADEEKSLKKELDDDLDEILNSMRSRYS